MENAKKKDKRYNFLNKKGQLESMLFVIIGIFFVGIIFLFVNHFNDQIFTKFDAIMEDNPELNNTESHIALQDIHEADNSVYDWAFLAIVLGLFIQLVLFAYATRISAVFYWLYIILSMMILTVGVVTSNMWQSLSENPEFATTITRFPITDTILGTYYPLVLTVGLMFLVIILFGKRQEAVLG